MCGLDDKKTGGNADVSYAISLQSTAAISFTEIARETSSQCKTSSIVAGLHAHRMTPPHPRTTYYLHLLRGFSMYLREKSCGGSSRRVGKIFNSRLNTCRLLKSVRKNRIY